MLALCAPFHTKGRAPMEARIAECRRSSLETCTSLRAVPRALCSQLGAALTHPARQPSSVFSKRRALTNSNRAKLMEIFRLSTFLSPHKNGVGPLEWTSALGYPGCFIGSCKDHPGLLRMVSFSKERDRNVFPCPFYCVKWGPQNLVITAPARIGFTVFNRVCSIGHPVIYDTARVITKGSNPTKSDQSGPTPFLCWSNYSNKHHHQPSHHQVYNE